MKTENIYYMIRHKSSGELMPQLNGKGYSHWNPSGTEQLTPRKLTGSPRLFSSRKKALRTIVQWNACPNSYYGHHTTIFGEDDYDINIKQDGRKKEDLEVIEVILSYE